MSVKFAWSIGEPTNLGGVNFGLLVEIWTERTVCKGLRLINIPENFSYICGTPISKKFSFGLSGSNWSMKLDQFLEYLIHEVPGFFNTQPKVKVLKWSWAIITSPCISICAYALINMWGWLFQIFLAEKNLFRRWSNFFELNGSWIKHAFLNYFHDLSWIPLYQLLVESLNWIRFNYSHGWLITLFWRTLSNQTMF